MLWADTLSKVLRRAPNALVAWLGIKKAVLHVYAKFPHADLSLGNDHISQVESAECCTA